MLMQYDIAIKVIDSILLLLYATTNGCDSEREFTLGLYVRCRLYELGLLGAGSISLPVLVWLAIRRSVSMSPPLIFRECE